MIPKTAVPDLAAVEPRDGEAISAARRGLRAEDVRMARLGDDEVVVKRGIAEVRLSADGIAVLLERLFDLADGSLTEDELVDSFDDRGDVAGRVVRALVGRGILHNDPRGTPQERFWSDVSHGSADLSEGVRNAAVYVTGGGPLAEALRRALGANGVRTLHAKAPEPSIPVDVWCAAEERHPDHGLTAQAQAALDLGVAFLPLWLDDLVLRVGPLTFPHDTACLRCALWRLESTDGMRKAHRLLRDDTVGAAYLPSMLEVAANLAAGEVVNHLAGLPVTLVGRLVEISTVPFGIVARRVLKVPRCPDCSGLAQRGAPVITHGSALDPLAP